jgi:maleylpyruvate isomerase
MILYEDKISSAASRVRIACALKGIEIRREHIPILGSDALNRKPEFLRLNPQGLVPALVTDNGELITQSLAIIEYLDERFAVRPLLPKEWEARAFARSIALIIAAEVHALLPPRVVAYLSGTSGFEADALAQWSRHWITEGLGAIEARLQARGSGPFVLGNTLSLADIFLFPQVLNAERAGIVLSLWPRIGRIFENLRALPEFAANAPAPRQTTSVKRS